MASANPYQKARLGLRAFKNMYITKKPLVVSFEVTHSCNCNCRHCDKGGIKPETNLLKPAEYAKKVKELKPPFVQISGGEPLLREDILDVVRSIRSVGTMPFIVFVTNAALLTEEKYLELKAAGVNRFSISLDFPDERHDEFRRHKGLFRHLEEIIPFLADTYNEDDIAMNCAITRANFRSLLEVAKLTTEWGIPVSYIAYSKLRTGDEDLFIYDKGEHKVLRKQIDDLIAWKVANKPKSTILNAVSTLNGTYKFFQNNGTPGCMAGERFLIVIPDGTLNACSMYPDKIYSSHDEMVQNFTVREKCADCYVAIRAYSGKSLTRMFLEMVGI